jgi:hypothetical protein
MGVYLTGAHVTSVYPIGASPVGVYLKGVYLMGVRSSHRHASYRRTCQSGKMLNCLSFYLDGGMYTFLYPLDARHPDPPQSLLGSGILMGQTPNGAIGC